MVYTDLFYTGEGGIKQILQGVSHQMDGYFLQAYSIKSVLSEHAQMVFKRLAWLLKQIPN
jgi:hypothetical protein